MSKITSCAVCGLGCAVDDDGTPYYPHDHTEGNNPKPTLVYDRRGNLIVDLSALSYLDVDMKYYQTTQGDSRVDE